MTARRSLRPMFDRRRYWSPRLFVADVDQPRAHRASDGVALILTFVALLILSLVAVPQSGFEATVTGIVAAFPDGMLGFWSLLIDLVRVFAAVLLIAVVWRRRWNVLRDVVMAALVALGLMFLIGRIMEGEWSREWSDVWFHLVGPLTVVAVTGVHLVRAFRRLFRWLIVLAWVGTVFSEMLAPVPATASVLVALAGAYVIALVFGSPRGRPDTETVKAALAELGVEVVELGVAARQAQGVFVLEGRTADGRQLDIKVYGRDAYDTQLLSTIWRAVWFRRAGSPVSPGRLQQVEHEALLTFLAAQHGVETQSVVIAGLAGNDDALIVLERAGARVDLANWSRERVEELFRMLGRLQDARITHGQIDDEHLIVNDGRLGLVDFRGGLVSGDPWRLQVDQVQAVVTAVLATGPEEAAAVVVDLVGEEAVGGILPYLQEGSLTPRQRDLLDGADVDLDNLRDRLAQTVGIEAPELVQLRRFTIMSALTAVLPFLAFFALASVFAGLDVDQLFETLSGASWWFVVVGVVISQLPRFTQTLSAMGASPVPVPMGRLYLLQLAQQYVALSIPGGAARIALNMRFFQRQGLPSGTALAVGAIDSFTGFLSQVILIVVVLSLTSLTLGIELSSPVSTGLVNLLLIVIGLGVLAAIVIAIVPRFRRPIVERIKTIGSDAMGAVRGLHSPRRLGLLFGGGLGTELLFAISLGAFALALGSPVNLPELILIVVLVGILAGVLPVPGGIGVMEGGLIFGLVLAGMPEEAAFAAAILYRFATYYVPPVWGVFAFRHLERHKHL